MLDNFSDKQLGDYLPHLHNCAKAWMFTITVFFKIAEVMKCNTDDMADLISDETVQ